MRRKIKFVVLCLLGVALAVWLADLVARPYFPRSAPPKSLVLEPDNRRTNQLVGTFDYFGKNVSADSVEAKKPGAIQITRAMIDDGREAFYCETFGNEVALTDMAGLLDGPMRPMSMATAILQLGGKQTTNLRVPVAFDTVIGGRQFKKGQLIDTGLDVPAGSLAPLGVKLSWHGGKLRAGITCAACHTTVDPESGKIIEGAPNSDMNAGLVLACATNSAVFFRNSGTNPLKLPVGSVRYHLADGTQRVLPDVKTFETSVDADLLSWPAGNFDSTVDIVNNPSQIPTTYTFGAWPYGWNGFASIGWFHGLTTLDNNVHAANADPTTGGDSSKPLYGIEKEMYFGLMLQNAADSRWKLPQNVNPAQFFATVKPKNLGPSIVSAVRMPGFPKGSLFMLDGLLANSPGQKYAWQLNALSAFQNSLIPPTVPHLKAELVKKGAQIFDKAGCIACHAGLQFTNNELVPVEQIKTQPSRAKAHAAFPKVFTAAQTYAPHIETSTASMPSDVLKITNGITPQRTIDLAYCIGSPHGGYKVQSLIGLNWSAPYLHDGAVGRASAPADSLRALLDRNVRAKLVAANAADPFLQRAHVTGQGHDFFVDEQAGMTKDDQTALIEFLRSIR